VGGGERGWGSWKAGMGNDVAVAELFLRWGGDEVGNKGFQVA